MADTNWEGRAVDIKQVDTITVANTWAQGDTVTITCDGLDFVITIGTLVTTAQVATTIKQAFNGETLTDTSASCTIPIADGGAQAIAQFAEAVATVSSSVVSLTARSTEGKPFTFTVTENTAGTGTATLAASIVPHGRHEGDNADNFSAGATLLDNDNLSFPDGSVDLLYDMNFAVQLASIQKSREYTGNVGLAVTNKNDSSLPYTEYRGLYAVTDDNSVTTTALLETGPQGRGSGRFKWNFGAGQFTATVFGKGARELTGVPCILLLGTHASNELHNLAGDVGVAFYYGETSTLAVVRHGDGPQSVAQTVLGSGVTLSSATVTINGGLLESNSAISAVNHYGGVHSHKSGTITTHNCQGGTGEARFKILGAVTVTTQTIGPRGIVDLTAGTGTVVFTNSIQMTKGAQFIDPQGRSGNPVFVLNRCNLEDVTIILPPGKTITTS